VEFELLIPLGLLGFELKHSEDLVLPFLSKALLLLLDDGH
jgi:hypothetical protein